VYTGGGATRLAWNAEADFARDSELKSKWEITDRYAYDEVYGPAGPRQPIFPVSDIRLRAGIELPKGSGSAAAAPDVAAIVIARGHEFRALISGGVATLAMRPQPTAQAENPAWQTLGTGPATLRAGDVTNVEFWHIDQSLQLWVEGKLVAHGEYEWTPAQRIEFATGRSLRDLFVPGAPSGTDLSNPAQYRKPTVAWEFSGGPVTMHRVAVDRDLFYVPATSASSSGSLVAARATHPATVMTLSPDQFFVCGDNSPMSLDARLWGPPDPWVAREIDPTLGVVPRDLMLGKAFFVYFPALAGTSPIPMPDFGKLRFIR
jgi:hypothetical protein